MAKQTKRGPGRPRLHKTKFSSVLDPQNWAWLEQQASISATLDKLIEAQRILESIQSLKKGKQNEKTK